MSRTRPIELRNLTEDDVMNIYHWPRYSPDFKELDYALRKGGWLDEFLHKSDTWCYGAEEKSSLVAFSILSKTGETEAEFRIALRGDKIGEGLGRVITLMTLAKGFFETGLSKIHLIVRKNNPRAFHLYKRLGFLEKRECWKIINKQEAQFIEMELLKDFFNSKGGG